MPKLKLCIDFSKPLGDGLFQELDLDGKEHRIATKDSDGDIKANAKKGVEALCFLIILTLHQQLSGQPKLSKIHIARLRTISSAWKKKEGRSREWMIEFFGQEPFPKLLTLDSGVVGQPVAFTNKIDLQVEHFLSEQALTALEIRQLFLIIGSETPYTPKTLKIEIETPEFIISSEHCKGALTKGHRVRLSFETNFPCEFCVFWIDSLNRAAELYPTLEIENFPGRPFLQPENARGMRLFIPGEGKLYVGTPPGVENCLVLTRRAPFTPTDVENIRNYLTEALPHRTLDGIGDSPSMNPLLFDESVIPKQVSGQRLETPPLSNDWEEELKSNLRPYTTQLWSFDIPNKGA